MRANFMLQQIDLIETYENNDKTRDNAFFLEDRPVIEMPKEKLIFFLRHFCNRSVFY